MTYSLKRIAIPAAVSALVSAALVFGAPVQAMAGHHGQSNSVHKSYSSHGKGHNKKSYNKSRHSNYKSRNRHHNYARGYKKHRSKTSVSLNFTGFYGSSYRHNPRYGYYSSGFYSPSYYYNYTPPRQTVIVREPVYISEPTYVQAPVAAKSRYTAPVSSDGGVCLQEREYQATITIGNEEVPAYGTACLQPDGSWKHGPAQPAQ